MDFLKFGGPLNTFFNFQKFCMTVVDQEESFPDGETLHLQKKCGQGKWYKLVGLKTITNLSKV